MKMASISLDETVETLVILCVEMFAKLESNDYFASVNLIQSI